MTSPTQWAWAWASSRNWWWTGKPAVLHSMELQSSTRVSEWTKPIRWLFSKPDVRVSFNDLSSLLSLDFPPLSLIMGLLFPQCGVFFFLSWCPYLGGAHPQVVFWKQVNGRLIFESNITKKCLILPLHLTDSLAWDGPLDWETFPPVYFLKVENISRILAVPCAVSQLTHFPLGGVTFPPSPID